MKIFLPDEVYEQAVETGLQRSKGKKHRDVGDAWAQNSDDSDGRHIFGASCEFLLAYVFGVEPNREIYRKGDNNAPDLVLQSGRTVEVKGNRRQGNGFCLRTADAGEFKADLGILVYSSTATPQLFEVAGWITQPDFLGLSNERNFGAKYGGVRRLVEAHLLSPFVSLIHDEGQRVEGYEKEIWGRCSPDSHGTH